MSTMAIDQSLDTIIANKKQARRPSGKAAASRKKRVSSVGKAVTRKGKAAIVGASPVVPPAATSPLAEIGNTATKINVSNLPTDVKENEIKDLFASTIGPLRSVTLHHDAQGKSKGMATIVFSRKGDANKALTQYNNRLVDGSRKMKVELVVEAPSPAKTPSLSQRVAPPTSSASTTSPTAGTKTGGKRRRVTRRPRQAAKNVSAADLDAQMEDYNGKP